MKQVRGVVIGLRPTSFGSRQLGRPTCEVDFVSNVMLGQIGPMFMSSHLMLLIVFWLREHFRLNLCGQQPTKFLN